MALPSVDNFNTPEDPLVTNWGYATGSTAQFRATSNIVTLHAAGEAVGYWKSDSFNNDQYSKIETTTYWITDFGPTVRCATGALTYYFFLVYSSTVCRMYKCINGSWTQLGSDYSVTVGNSVPIKLSVSGTTLTPNVNGTDLATRTDSGITSGSAGFRINQPDAYSNQLDNWEGGNIGGGAPTIKVQDGKSRIKITTAQTQIGKSRLSISSTQTQIGKGKISLSWRFATSLTIGAGAISSGALTDTYADDGTELILTEIG